MPRCAPPPRAPSWSIEGGAAVTSNRFSLLDTATGIGLASLDTTRWGGTVGVGFEYGFRPGWSVGVEYDHPFMGHADNTLVNGISVIDHPLFAGALNHITEDVDMVTVRFNTAATAAATRPIDDFLDLSGELEPRHFPGLFRVAQET